MASFKLTLTDTIHVFAVVAVVCLLMTLVISRHEPEWADFMLGSMAVVSGSAVLARLINRPRRR